MTLSTLSIRKEHCALIKDFGYSEKEFIKAAIQDKLAELKKIRFFALSEKVRQGLQKKGISPQDILWKIKS